MKFRPILVDSTLQELTDYGTKGFPMTVDEQHVSDIQCGYIKHWHYEMQISLVTMGSVLFRSSAGNFLVNKGEAVFINSTCLHEAVPTEDRNSIYICVNFDPKIIFGYSGSTLYQYYVEPVIHCEQMQVFHLCNESYHKDILDLIRRIIDLDSCQDYGYELAIQILLQKIWLLLLLNNRNILDKHYSVSFYDRQRLRTIQNFIHKNYRNKLSLAEIADSAHISRNECCRLFRRILNMSPFQYLIKYRIAQSVTLLDNTGHSILEIAYSVGFGSNSYFTECFKKEMYCTPMEYRKHRYIKNPEKNDPIKFK